MSFHPTHLRALGLGAAFALACGKGGPEQDSQTTASADGSATDTDPTAATETDSMTGTTGGTTDETDTNPFIVPPDGDDGIIECDVWSQDCEVGKKCMPWANNGGNAWNATKCVPLAPNPKQPGDDCTVEGSGVSGIDDCDVSSMCWDVDPETNMGVCVAFCTGSEASPSCEDPDTGCVIVNDGVLILCLPECDPLIQDCVDGQACYPVADSFVCVPDASGPDLGVYADPCEFLNACDPGLWCAAADAVPGCQGSQGCCSEYCDLSDPNPASMCQGAGLGQDCVAAFEMGNAPPGYDDVGLCAIPQG